MGYAELWSTWLTVFWNVYTAVFQIGSSSYTTLTSQQGIPQESKLGSLLFLINVNDIVNVPDSPELNVYADNTNVFFTSRRIDGLEGKVNMYLNSLSLWLRQNQLQLNAFKTTYVIFYLINRLIERPLTVKFEECIISKVKQQNF